MFLKTRPTYPLIMGPLLIQYSITITIITLTNRTLVKTSVLFFQLILYHLIFNSPLLCTSCGDLKICLPPIYDLIEFSPNDQIQPNFLSLLSVQISTSRLISFNEWTYIDGATITFPIVLLMEYLFLLIIAQVTNCLHPLSYVCLVMLLCKKLPIYSLFHNTFTPKTQNAPI